MKFYFHCPRCGNDEGFVKPSESTSGLGCSVFFWGGFFPSLILADHFRRRVMCPRCSHIFLPPPIPSSPYAKLSVWLTVLVILPVIAFFFLPSDLTSELPSNDFVESLQTYLTSRPRAALYLLAWLLLLLLIPWWIVASLSNRRHRKAISAIYRLYPFSLRDRPTKPSGTDKPVASNPEASS